MSHSLSPIWLGLSLVPCDHRDAVPTRKSRRSALLCHTGPNLGSAHLCALMSFQEHPLTTGDWHVSISLWDKLWSPERLGGG
jgi:hypothetical protein